MERIIKYLFIIAIGISLNSLAQGLPKNYRITSAEERLEAKKDLRKISFTKLLKECKQASKNKKTYVLENCEIYYAPEDTVFLSKKEDRYFKEKFSVITLKDTIDFPDTVKISNCKFPDGMEIIIKNWNFTRLTTEDVTGDYIVIDNATISEKIDMKRCSDLEIINSTINKLYIHYEELPIEKKTGWIKKGYEFIGNKIGYLSAKNIRNLNLEKNLISYFTIGGKNGTIKFKENIFEFNARNVRQITQVAENTFNLDFRIGVDIKADFESLSFTNNIAKNGPTLKKDSLLKIIKQYNLSRNSRSVIMNSKDTIYTFNKRSFDSYFKSLISKEQLNVLEEKYDSLHITYNKYPYLKIKESNIQKLTIDSTNFNLIDISKNNIEKNLILKNILADTIFIFWENSTPKDISQISLDNTIFRNLGISHNGQYWHGDETYLTMDYIFDNNHKNKREKLTIQVRKLITILSAQGSPVRKDGVFKLKTIETNNKYQVYYLNPTMNNWFNWKGYEFLKWYSDYGMNPFKALTYCFWAMLYFAMFYFIFYNEWDKIDRGFLIKRFNSVMDYFTTEKRIEDFYSSTHDKEMTTFTEFKETLDKNKVYMPAMLASLAKPIYQMSLLRYKILSFSYKKAEFMAGRKWVDLEQKEKYWIGTLTFFLTLTYIIYLVFIRALNSIVLSINAFSTLGFGQIPVRGFTKYVAIIEGFIGWFLLSIFLVSVLSQMMSV